MAATKLATSMPRRARNAWLAGLRRYWTLAYTATWVLTIAAWALVAIDPARLSHPVRGLLELSLSPEHNPAPNIGHVFALIAHNVPLAAWPLLLGVVGAHRHRLARRAADLLLAGWLAANVLPVGAALGTYGSPLLAYLPQVPFEWAALALGTSAWLMQRQAPLTVRQGTSLFAVIAGVLLCAAVLETVAVPHR